MIRKLKINGDRINHNPELPANPHPNEQLTGLHLHLQIFANEPQLQQIRRS